MLVSNELHSLLLVFFSKQFFSSPKFSVTVWVAVKALDRAGEVSQQLGALAALPELLDSFFSTCYLGGSQPS